MALKKVCRVLCKGIDEVSEAIPIITRSAKSGSINTFIKASKSSSFPCICRAFSFDKINRFSINDKIKLRDSDELLFEDVSHYKLKIVIGDLSKSEIKCEKITDKLYFISDDYMEEISGVKVGGDNPSIAYSLLNNYTDNSGHRIAAIRFSQSVTGNVTCSGKGVINSNNDLIENPADILEYILLNVQQYSSDIIDKESMFKLKEYANQLDLKQGFIIEDQKIRDIFDLIVGEIYGYWNISDGKTYFNFFE